jgi:ubiquinol-cytochrome c reductase cytochrome b subunit
MQQKNRNWLNERLPLGGFINTMFDEKIHGGASFFYVLGSATLFVFVLQVLTGIWQLFYYVPTVDHAYASSSYLRVHVHYGWLIYGIHYWGANIMAVLVALHIIRVFIWGAYKKPRELTWLLGVLLLFLTAGLIFTGAALPWDETGYWASEVGTSIAGTIPVIGSYLEAFLRGGSSMGQLTLSRFFAFHTALIPALAFIIIVLHLIAFRKYGSVGPWKESKRKKTGDFWPDQVAIDLIVAGFIFVLLVWLSAFHPAPFTGPADPADAAFEPKPEWNFLFLYQLLKLFKGPYEVIGTIVIPLLIVLLFIITPFIDKKASHSPLKRMGMMTGGLVFVLFILIYTILGVKSNPAGNNINISVSSNTIKKPNSYTSSPTAIKGDSIYHTYGCAACHTMSGSGGKIGPDLTNEYMRNRSIQWLSLQITDSKAHFPSSVMPDYSMLSKEQLGNLVEYLNSAHPEGTKTPADSVTVNIAKTGITSDSLAAYTKMQMGKLGAPGEAASIIGNVVVGRKLFVNNCASCHGVDGKGGDPNYGSEIGIIPALYPVNKALYSQNPKQFAENIDVFIQHGSVPVGAYPVQKMFDYGDSYSLTQPQIANIEAYILNLNHVNRAQIEAPKSAKIFFYITAILYLTFMLWLIIYWPRTNKNQHG